MTRKKYIIDSKNNKNANRILLIRYSKTSDTTISLIKKQEIRCITIAAMKSTIAITFLCTCTLHVK